MREIVFILPSAIHIGSTALSYSSVRSIYSAEERALQTKEGIESIRKRVPASRVILSEVGLKRDLPFGIEKLADRYVYCGENPAVRRIVDGPNKGHGEVVSLIMATKAVKDFRANYYFKMSGRYRLDNRFDLSKWVGRRDCFLGIKYNEGCVGTRLYGWPSELYGAWRAALIKALPDLRFGWAIENTLPKLIPNFNALEVVGLSGMIAPYGCGVVE